MHQIRKWYFSHISGLNSSIKRRKSWKFTPLSSAALRASYAWRRASLETGWEYGYFSSYTPMQCTAKHSRFGNINEPSAGSLGYPTLWMIDVNEDDVCWFMHGTIDHGCCGLKYLDMCMNTVFTQSDAAATICYAIFCGFYPRVATTILAICCCTFA